MTDQSQSTLFARMALALRECSDDLEAEIRFRYGGSGRVLYPAEQKELDLDMKSVVVARKLLSELQEQANDPIDRSMAPNRDSAQRRHRDPRLRRGANFGLDWLAKWCDGVGWCDPRSGRKIDRVPGIVAWRESTTGYEGRALTDLEMLELSDTKEQNLETAYGVAIQEAITTIAKQHNEIE